MVIDHPEAATLALGPPGVCPPQLAEAAGSWDDVSGFRISNEKQLKGDVVILGQIVKEELCEERRLNELHRNPIIRKLRMDVNNDSA